MSKKKRTSKGGYLFRKFKGEPSSELERLKVPSRIVIPLRQGYGEEVKPLVDEGDTVRAGQVVGRNDDAICSPIHASIGGKVVGIMDVPVSGSKERALVIETDSSAEAGKREVDLVPGFDREWNRLSEEKIEELLYLTGVTALGKGGIPTRFRSSSIQPEEVEAIVVVGLEDELLSPSVLALLPEGRIPDLVEGIKILKKIMTGASTYIVIDQSQKNLISALNSTVVNGSDIEMTTLKPKYPYSREELLVTNILGREFPYGFAAINIGVLVLTLQDLLQVYRAVTEGFPLIERNIAVAGTGFNEPKHLLVPVGISTTDILDGRLRSDGDYRIVRDSLMTGKKVESEGEPILRNARALYAIPEKTFIGKFSWMKGGAHSDSFSNVFTGISKKDLDTNLHGEERTCLSCSFCAEVCPTGIQPNILHQYVVNDLISETMVKFRIFHCLDCNLCTYVCPSKIPLDEHMKTGKKRLLGEGFVDLSSIALQHELKGVQR